MDSTFSVIAVLLLAGLAAGVWEAVRLLRRMAAQLSAPLDPH